MSATATTDAPATSTDAPKERPADPNVLPVDAAVLTNIIEATVRREVDRREIGRPNPMMLKSFDDIQAFAEHAQATDIVPKDYKGKPGNIIVAIMLGVELGLPPIQALQCVAVINGRPAVWGAAIPGLCRASGLLEDVEEYFEGEEGSDDYTHVTRIKRRGVPRIVEGRFSQADAKKAGLFGKNVHATYPKRMMQWRSRGYAYTDAFPDVLRGISIAEVVAEDTIEPLAWDMPTPERDWFAVRKGDSPFVAKARERLHGEPSAWRWLGLLDTILKEAPTPADVEAIAKLPVVIRTTENAPFEGKNAIRQSFETAHARLTPPQEQTGTSDAKSTNQQNPTPDATDQQRQTRQNPGDTRRAATETATTAGEAQEQPSGDDGAEFEYYLMDERGEPVGSGAYTSPVLWAEAFLHAWTHSTDGRLALVEHNSDAIADARALSEEATNILADLDATPEAEPAVEVMPAIVRGKADWPTYVKDINTALAATTAANFYDWCSVQTPRIEGAPASTRMVVIAAIAKRAEALQLTPPVFEPREPSQQQQQTTAGAATIEIQDPDKDTILCTNFCVEIARQRDLRALNRYTQQTHVVGPRKRWLTERPELVERLDAAHKWRLEQLSAAEQTA